MRSNRLLAVPALLIAAVFPAGSPASPPGAGEPLWSAAVGEGPCAVELINELGGIDVRPSDQRIVVWGKTPELAIEAVHGAGDVKLTVTDGGRSAGGDVELQVPPRCDVTVRTGDGAVDVDLGPRPLKVAVETVTGAITVRADPAAAVTIDLATSGEITTDYTIAIDFRYHQEPAKYGRVQVVGGGSATGATAEVHLTSRRGAVRVLRPSSSP